MKRDRRPKPRALPKPAPAPRPSVVRRAPTAADYLDERDVHRLLSMGAPRK